MTTKLFTDAHLDARSTSDVDVFVLPVVVVAMQPSCPRSSIPFPLQSGSAASSERNCRA